jgi:hypothetical protein
MDHWVEDILLFFVVINIVRVKNSGAPHFGKTLVPCVRIHTAHSPPHHQS